MPKRACRSSAQAEIAAENASRKTGELIIAYQCYDCSAFHVGHADLTQQIVRRPPDLPLPPRDLPTLQIAHSGTAPPSCFGNWFLYRLLSGSAARLHPRPPIARRSSETAPNFQTRMETSSAAGQAYTGPAPGNRNRESLRTMDQGAVIKASSTKEILCQLTTNGYIANPVHKADPPASAVTPITI